jgi:hypothetical protein
MTVHCVRSSVGTGKGRRQKERRDGDDDGTDWERGNVTMDLKRIYS